MSSFGHGSRLRSVVGVSFAVVGGLTLLFFNQPHYPLSEWMLWQYLPLLGLAAAFTLACLCVGDRIVRWVVGAYLGTHERVALALAVGVFAVEMLMFVLGLLGLWSTTLFVVLPLVCIATNVTAARDLVRRARRLLASSPRLSPRHLLAILFGLGILGLIYFLILTPYNVQFDSRWKHMALAEDYVAHGGVRRMDEGWVFSTRPHFTTFAYGWAFLLPFGTLFHRMVLCAHIEYFLFALTTFFGIPAVVRRLIPRADPRLVWVARFLFPGILVYDSTLSAGADHFGAIFAPAVVLTLIRAFPRLDRRWCWLLITSIAGACLVKETTAIMLAPIPFAVMLGRFGFLAVRALGKRGPESMRSLWLTCATTAFLGLALTAPYWLRNWVWHGNPLYPQFGDLFPSRPWSAWSSYKFEHEYSDLQMWQPPRTWDGVLRSLLATVDFSFIPNDWKKFHGDRPVFGSLFTLFVPFLFLLKGTRRIWYLVLGLHGAIFTWFWVHHQDRYLQAILPLLAAATAAILVLVIRQLRAWPRRALLVLVVLQLAVAADLYFLPTHAMAGSAVKKVVDTLGMGHQKKYAERFTIEPKMTQIGKSLPENARILFHEQQSHLGTGRESVQDTAFWQYGIDYGRMKDPLGVHRMLGELGVTHIYFSTVKSLGMDTLAGDFMFFDYVHNRAGRRQNFDNVAVVEVPERLRDASFNHQVLLFSCASRYRASLHQVLQLALPGYGPKSRSEFPALRTTTDREQGRAWLEEVDMVGADPKCDLSSVIGAHFSRVAERPKRGRVGAYHLFLRKKS